MNSAPGRTLCQHLLKIDALATVEHGPPWVGLVGVGGGGRVARIAVFELVGVAPAVDAVGVTDPLVDHGGGDGVDAEDLTPSG